VAYQTGGGGYGGVYRPLPNVAQQTVHPPTVQVGDPPLPVDNTDSLDSWPSSYWALPWPQVQLQQGASQRVPPLRIGADPISFPKLGQWQPETMDPSDTSRQFAQFRLRLLPVNGPAVPFPKLGQWWPSRADLAWPVAQSYWNWRADVPFIPVAPPAANRIPLPQWPGEYFEPETPRVQLAQRLPVIPPIIIISGIPYPTWPALYGLHLSAFERDWPVPELTQRLPLAPVGDAPVPFPFLGDWQPGSMDQPSVRIQVMVRPPLVGIGDAAVPFSTVPYPGAYFSPAWPQIPLAQRLPIVQQVVIIAGVPYLTPPALYGLHGPAFLRDWSLPTLTQRLPFAAVGAPAVAFPETQQPYPVSGPSPILFAQRLPLIAPPLLIVGIPYPTPAAWYAMHLAALQRDFPLEVLQRVKLIAVGGAPVAFPKLGSWQPGSMNPPDVSVQLTAFRLRLAQIGSPAVPFPPPPTWNAITPPPVVWSVYGQRLPKTIFIVPLYNAYPIRFTDLSGPRYLMTDASGALYEAVDLGNGRYLMTDASGERYLGIDASGARFTETEN
jgi:hypothetical protein